jgi:hypothetical protein
MLRPIFTSGCIASTSTSESGELLKNVNGALPLKKPGKLILIGSDAPARIAGPNEAANHDVDGDWAIGWGSRVSALKRVCRPSSRAI